MRDCWIDAKASPFSPSLYTWVQTTNIYPFKLSQQPFIADGGFQTHAFIHMLSHAG